MSGIKTRSKAPTESSDSTSTTSRRRHSLPPVTATVTKPSVAVAVPRTVSPVTTKPAGSVTTRSSTLAKDKDGSLIYKRRSLEPQKQETVSKYKIVETPIGSRKRSVEKETQLHHQSLTHTPKKRRTIRKSGLAQEAEGDFYCWLCHADVSDSVCCELCPRVYHLRCLGLDKMPASDWVCPECEKTLRAECADTKSKAMSMLTLDQVCALLKYALQRMKHAESEAFHRPVDVSQHPTYLDHIIKPMDLSTLEKNIRRRIYGSTEAFLADSQWILHNCMIFNGPQHHMTTSAKMIMKICKHEMNEIEICPDCYLNSCIQRTEKWFCEPCRDPHPLVWAKMKGYPFWPAKALREVGGQVDVRFFGEHDRAWVSVHQVFFLSVDPPTGVKNKKHGFEESMHELELHIERLKEKFGSFEYSPYRTPYNTKHPYRRNKAKHAIGGDAPPPTAVTPTKFMKRGTSPSCSETDASLTVVNNDAIAEISKPKPTKSAVTRTASAVRSKYNSIITTRRAKQTESPSSCDAVSQVSQSPGFLGKSQKVEQLVDDENKPHTKKKEKTELVSETEKTSESQGTIEKSTVLKQLKETMKLSKESCDLSMANEKSTDKSAPVVTKTEPDKQSKQSCDLSTPNEKSPGKTAPVSTKAEKLETVFENKKSGTSEQQTKDSKAEDLPSMEVDQSDDRVADAEGNQSAVAEKETDQSKEEVTDSEAKGQSSLAPKPNPFLETLVKTCKEKLGIETPEEVSGDAEEEDDEEEEEAGEEMESSSEQESSSSELISATSGSRPSSTDITTPGPRDVEAGDDTAKSDETIQSKLKLPETNQCSKLPETNQSEDTSHSKDQSAQKEPEQGDTPMDQSEKTEKQTSEELIDSTKPVSNDSQAKLAVSSANQTPTTTPALELLRHLVSQPPLDTVAGEKQDSKLLNNGKERQQIDGESAEELKCQLSKTSSHVEAIEVTQTPTPDSKTCDAVQGESVTSPVISIPKSQPPVTPLTSPDPQTSNKSMNTSEPVTTASPVTVDAPRSQESKVQTGSTSLGQADSSLEITTPTSRGMDAGHTASVTLSPVTSLVTGDAQSLSSSSSASLPEKLNSTSSIISPTSGASVSVIGTTPGAVSNTAPIFVAASTGNSGPVSSSSSGLPHREPVPLGPLEFKLGAVDLKNYTEKLMSSIQEPLQKLCVELLQVEASEAIKNHYQTELDRMAWHHRTQLAELRHNAELNLYEMKSLQLEENKRNAAEIRKVLEQEKKKAVEETKKKQWCAQCGKEAIFYCCWNTSYCDYPCQQAHWPDHMTSCTHSQNSKSHDQFDSQLAGKKEQQQQQQQQPQIVSSTTYQHGYNNITSPQAYNMDNSHTHPGQQGAGVRLQYVPQPGGSPAFQPQHGQYAMPGTSLLHPQQHPQGSYAIPPNRPLTQGTNQGNCPRLFTVQPSQPDPRPMRLISVPTLYQPRSY